MFFNNSLFRGSYNKRYFLLMSYMMKNLCLFFNLLGKADPSAGEIKLHSADFQKKLNEEYR